MSPDRSLPLPGAGLTAAPAQHECVVVGVDGSASSAQALRWARFMADTTGSPLHAVAVWQPLSSYTWATAGWAAVPGDWDPAGDTEKMLQSTLDDVFGADRPPALHTTVQEGIPAKVLLDYSRTATMLVVGSRGHGGFAGLMLGSVSTACAEHATCPVLVIHGSTAPPPLPN
jgi:nucleotide-binding universal stress UspA family protein